MSWDTSFLGHRMDSNFAFFDQLLVDDKDTFRHFGFGRTPAEETAANAEAIKLLNNSPYKNQLGNAALFLTALQNREKEIPNLISAHLGDRVPAIADLKSTTAADPEAEPADDRGVANWRPRETGSVERQAGVNQEQTGGHHRRAREDAVRGDAVYAVPDAVRQRTWQADRGERRHTG